MTANVQAMRFQQGTALVETVICLPLLLFLMMAAGEIAHAFLQHNTLTKAVRDGARHASGLVINHGQGTFFLSPEIISDTKSLVVFGHTSGIGTALLPNLSLEAVEVSEVGFEIVEVRATYAYTGILGAMLPSLGSGPDHPLAFDLQASVQMRGL